MYFTDCKVINQSEEIDVQRFKGYKAIGFISLTSEDWKTDTGKDRLQFLEQYLVLKDECFFYITTELDVRAKFISIVRQCNKEFEIDDNQDFLIYYKTEDVSFRGTDIRITKLPELIDDALEEIEETIDDLKRGLVIAQVKIEILKKSGVFLFEVLKKLTEFLVAV